MKLTPLDIRKQDFSRKFRGYDPEEVQVFLNMAAAKWEEMGDERQGLENKLTELRAKLERYEKVEMALEEALRITRESSEATIRNAEDKARNLIDKAEAEARSIEENARRTASEIRRQSLRLNDYRLELMARLRALLASETELLARYEEHTAAALDKLQADGEGDLGSQQPEYPEAAAPRKVKLSGKTQESASGSPRATAETNDDNDDAPDAGPDAPTAAPEKKAKKTKVQEKVGDKPDSSSDIQHIRRILNDLD